MALDDKTRLLGPVDAQRLDRRVRGIETDIQNGKIGSGTDDGGDTGVFVPVGPVGGLITPPTLAPVTGYPLRASDLGFDSLEPTTPWGVLDLSSVGSFSNALVLSHNAGSSNQLCFVNLDNPTQKTFWPLGTGFSSSAVADADQDRAASYLRDFAMHNGELTHAFRKFSDGAWQNTNFLAEDTGYTQNVSATQLGMARARNSTHRFSAAAGFKQSLVGAPAPSRMPGSQYGAPDINVTVLAATETHVCWARNSYLFQPNLRFSGIYDGSYVQINVPLSFFSYVPGSSYFSDEAQTVGLSDGRMGYLKRVQAPPGFIALDFEMYGIDGSITVQSNVFVRERPPTVGNASASYRIVALPGHDSFLVVEQNPSLYEPDFVFQVSAAGSQQIALPSEKVESPRLSDAGLLRWWGSDVRTSTALFPNQALYEAAI